MMGLLQFLEATKSENTSQKFNEKMKLLNEKSGPLFKITQILTLIITYRIEYEKSKTVYKIIKERKNLCIYRFLKKMKIYH